MTLAEIIESLEQQYGETHAAWQVAVDRGTAEERRAAYLRWRAVDARLEQAREQQRRERREAARAA